MSGLEQGGKHLRMTEVQEQTKRSPELTLVVNGKKSEGKLGKNQHNSGLIVESESFIFQRCPFLGSCTTTLKALSIEMINLWWRFMHMQIKSGNQ